MEFIQLTWFLILCNQLRFRYLDLILAIGKQRASDSFDASLDVIGYDRRNVVAVQCLRKENNWLLGYHPGNKDCKKIFTENFCPTENYKSRLQVVKQIRDFSNCGEVRIDKTDKGLEQLVIESLKAKDPKIVNLFVHAMIKLMYVYKYRHITGVVLKSYEDAFRHYGFQVTPVSETHCSVSKDVSLFLMYRSRVLEKIAFLIFFVIQFLLMWFSIRKWGRMARANEIELCPQS